MTDSSGRYRCPSCGRFLGRVRAWVRGDRYAIARGEAEISSVTGRCGLHGTQEVTAWDYEDFFMPRPKAALAPAPAPTQG